MESGLRLLPLMLSMVVSSIIFGITTQKTGYYTPFGIAGSCIMSIGAGLLTTLQVDTVEGKWIGYQVLYGFGMGLCFQTPNLAVQTVLPTKDVPIGIALMFFGQLLGGAVFVSVGENVLSGQLLRRLSTLPGFDASLVTSGSVTSLMESLPMASKEAVLVSYNEALQKVLQIGLVLSCLTSLGTAALQWRSTLHKQEPDADEDIGTQAGKAEEEA